MDVQILPENTKPENRLPVGMPRSTPVAPPRADMREVVAHGLAHALDAVTAKRQAAILGAPGVAEGFEQIYSLIQDWQKNDL